MYWIKKPNSKWKQLTSFVFDATLWLKQVVESAVVTQPRRACNTPIQAEQADTNQPLQCFYN